MRSIFVKGVNMEQLDIYQVDVGYVQYLENCKLEHSVPFLNAPINWGV